MKEIKPLKFILKRAIKDRIIYISLGIIVLVGLLIWLIYPNKSINYTYSPIIVHTFDQIPVIKDQSDKVFNKFFTYTADPFLAVVAGIFGFIIWLNQYSKKVIEKLPKRMTVHFKLKDKIIASCYEAAIAHEGDIRQWSQQIGKQMLGGDLKMFPYFNIDNPIIVKSETEKRYSGKKDNDEKEPIEIYLYNVTIFLNAKDAKDILVYGGEYERKNTIIWYENTPDQPDNKTLEYSKGFYIPDDNDKPYDLTEIKSNKDFAIPDNKTDLKKEINDNISSLLKLNNNINSLSKDDKVKSETKNETKKKTEVETKAETDAIIFLKKEKQKLNDKISKLINEYNSELNNEDISKLKSDYNSN
jgi:hypothetical protein